MAKRKRKIVGWSDEDVRNLRAFAKAKLSGPQTVRKLRRTPGAVAQKAMKPPVGYIPARPNIAWASPSKLSLLLPRI